MYIYIMYFQDFLVKNTKMYLFKVLRMTVHFVQNFLMCNILL